ncbi:MAG: DUF1080 domain-containing protein, partial [Bacteroidota bacterium]
MKTITATSLMVLLLISLIAWTPEFKADKQTAEELGNWTMLFNGTNLDGWRQLNGKAKYSVENGEIVGTTVANTPNSFLATEKLYGDFILELEFKVDPAMNSGVQIRSNSLPEYRDGRVHGYQMEIDPSPRAWTGGIYDEGRRGWLYPLEQNPPARKAFRQNEWNHYRVECIGSSIRTWVNGIPCTDLIDDMTAEGFIALQVHSIRKDDTPGKQIRWRNIKIQTDNLIPTPWTGIPVVNNIPNHLSPQERAMGWQLLFDGETSKGWRGVYKDAFPAKGWKVEDGELIVLSGDGGESTNGGDIVTMDEYDLFEFSLEFKITEGANSGIKYFITEQYKDGKGGGSAIGLEYQILDDDKHPDAKKGSNGNRTVASLYDLIPAHESKAPKAIGEWNHARIVVRTKRTPDWPNHRDGAESFSGAVVEHWLNHRKVLQYNRGDQMFEALVQRSKYKDWEGFGYWQSGHILLQDHGDEVHF